MEGGAGLGKGVSPGGNVQLIGGYSKFATGGDVKVASGVTDALTSGDIDIYTQNSVLGQSGYIKLTTGEQFPLWIPSGAETGLKLVRPFTVAQGSTTRLVIDFDLRKSITAPPGQDPNYVMRPALRLLDQLQVGKLTANVDLAALAHAQLGATATPASCKAGLYVFSGGTAVPDDQDGDNTNGASPVLYQPIAFDGVNTQVPVSIAFLEVGTYTVAATCNFDVDAADTDDYNPTATQGQPGYQTMHWTTVGNVAITANTTTTITLP